jgi:Ca2+-binding RTX toxin-like protein
VAIAVAVTLGGAWTGLPRLASAGAVRVEGSVVIFKAGNNEVNNIVINVRGAAFNPATGQFVQGFTVNDSAPITAGPGCQKFVGPVVCDITQASFISLDLGDKNDTLSQQEGGEPGDVVSMRVKGGSGNDTLTGGSLGDVLDGELGDDTITGGGGSDSILGGLGKDTINARDGQNDTINCGLGHDVVTADAADTKKRCN